MTTERGKWDWDAAWWGLSLLVTGTVFLLANTGLLSRDFHRYWWPLAPIAFGILRLVTGRSAKAISEGVFLVLIGGWLLATIMHWQGLTWRTSWPLALIAVGASSLVETIAEYFMPKPPMQSKRDKGREESGSCI